MAAGSDVVAISSVAIVITMLRVPLFAWACVGVIESVTVTTKVDVPAEVPFGVPEITPPLLKPNPEGRLPDAKAHV